MLARASQAQLLVLTLQAVHAVGERPQLGVDSASFRRMLVRELSHGRLGAAATRRHARGCVSTHAQHMQTPRQWTYNDAGVAEPWMSSGVAIMSQNLSSASLRTLSGAGVESVDTSMRNFTRCRS